MALRDIALLHYFGFAQKSQRPELTTLVYLALLYWLIPGLLKLMQLDGVAMLFLPPVSARPLVSIAVICLHLSVIGFLLFKRWRRRMRPQPVDAV